MAEGLRERKMRAARRSMERAAVEIAYDEGIAAVTVDRVCAAALVSRSTFFNYFASLDQAIFGSALEYDPHAAERILDRHSGDLMIAACLIVMDSVRGQTDDEVTRGRFALFAREPGTVNAVSWASHESRERLVLVIQTWLDDHPAHSRLPGADHSTEARLTVGLSIALGDEVLRHVREIDGEFPVDLATLREARRRITAITAPID